MRSATDVRVAALAACAAVAIGCSSQATPSAPSSSGSPRPHTTASSSASPSSSPSPSPSLTAAVAGWQLPAARSREVTLATAGGLVVAGGLSSAHVSTATVWVLSTSGKVLHAGSLAIAVHDATGLVVNRVPFVFAGGNTATVSDVQAIANIDTARGQIVGRLPQPRSDLSAAFVGGSGFVLGGFDGSTSLSQILRTADGRHFAPFGQLARTVRYAAVAATATPAGDQLLVFGGEHDGVPIDDVQAVDLKTGRTGVVGHLPQPLAHEAAFELGGNIWLVGGRSHDQLQSRIWRWDATRHRAVAAGRLPYAVADAGLAVSDPTTAYLIGGEAPDPTSRVIVLRVG